MPWENAVLREFVIGRWRIGSTRAAKLMTRKLLRRPNGARRASQHLMTSEIAESTSSPDQTRAAELGLAYRRNPILNSKTRSPNTMAFPFDLGQTD